VGLPPALWLHWSLLTVRAGALAAVICLLTGCGYIGSTLPPLANIPADPTDLAALQRGSTIYAHFKVPDLTTEQRPIKGDITLDLRAGPAPNPWNLAQWSEQAHQFAPQTVQDGVAQYQFPSLAWSGKEITIAARVTAENGKSSNWSSLVTLPVAPPLPTPGDLIAEGAPKGVQLTWRGTGRFRILRRAEGSPDYAEIGASETASFLDTTAEFGKQYSYEVQAFEDLGNHREAQSDPTPARTVAYKDVFPPAAPAGLRATPSASAIELSWDANSESDLAGYRVYRSVIGGAFEKIADVSEIPTYSDKAVQAGKTYRYQITAVDKSGNESSRSTAVEADLR
jgi:hypothetical protein